MQYVFDMPSINSQRTLRQLRHFLVLAEELHFGKAAHRLNMAQPPLSMSLRQLEDSLGFQLMERSNKSVRLTPAGAVFAAHVAKVIGQLGEAEEAARQVASGSAGKLTVAFIPSLLFCCLPPLLKAFQKRYPEIDLHIQEMNSACQIEQLSHHHIDVGFVHDAPFPEGIASLPLEQEKLMCCVPSQHRLAKQSRVALQDLADDPILLFARDFAAHYYDRIAGLLHAAGLEPHTSFRIQHWFTVVALVNQEMGVAIVPEALSRHSFPDVTYLQLDGVNAEHKVSLVWKRDRLSEAANLFIDSAREQLQRSA